MPPVPIWLLDLPCPFGYWISRARPVIGTVLVTPTSLAALLLLQLHFEGKFETERLSRLEREGRILKQLADHEQDVTDDFDTERVSRCYCDLAFTRGAKLRRCVKNLDVSRGRKLRRDPRCSSNNLYLPVHRIAISLNGFCCPAG